MTTRPSPKVGDNKTITQSGTGDPTHSENHRMLLLSLVIGSVTGDSNIQSLDTNSSDECVLLLCPSAKAWDGYRDKSFSIEFAANFSVTSLTSA